MAASIVLVFVGLYVYSNRPTVDCHFINYTRWHNEQALEDLSLSVQLPSYLPNQLTMRGAMIHVVNGKHTLFDTRYLDRDNRGGFKLYVTPGRLVDVDLRGIEGFDWDEVPINDHPGYIGRGLSEPYPTQIIWEMDSIRYTIWSYELSA